MNEEHWNTIDCDSDDSQERICWLIGHSYELVASSLPRRRRPA
jgi:predicted DNA-binding protein (MmcQ/YjbR family)